MSLVRPGCGSVPRLRASVLSFRRAVCSPGLAAISALGGCVSVLFSDSLAFWRSLSPFSLRIAVFRRSCLSASRWSHGCLISTYFGLRGHLLPPGCAVVTGLKGGALWALLPLGRLFLALFLLSFAAPGPRILIGLRAFLPPLPLCGRCGVLCSESAPSRRSCPTITPPTSYGKPRY